MRSRLTDLGVAAIPFVRGLFGPGAHGAGWSLPLSAALSVALYWRYRAPFTVPAVSFVLGLAQVTAALVDGPIARTLPGFYDLAIIIAIYSAVAYGARATRLFAVAGGIGGAVLASLSDGAEAAIEQQNIGEARKAVAAIGRTGRDALTDVRLLLGMLRSDRGLAEPQPGSTSSRT